MAKRHERPAEHAPMMGDIQLAPKWIWQFSKPWKTGWHDSSITPGTKKLITPYGIIIALVTPGHGPHQPAFGTFFEFQHGDRNYTGWCYAKPGGDRVALNPDRAFAQRVMRALFRQFPDLRARCKS